MTRKEIQIFVTDIDVILKFFKFLKDTFTQINDSDLYCTINFGKLIFSLIFLFDTHCSGSK